MTSNAQKVISPQISPTISSIYLTFLSDNLVCFYTQNSKKVTFPSSCANNIGNSFDIFGWQSSVFLLIFDFFVWYTSVFLHKISKKSLFPQIATIVSGTFLIPKRPKSDFLLKLTLQYWAFFLTFLSDNLSSFYSQNSKKVTFPSNCAYNIGHFFDFFGWQSSMFWKL